MLVARAYTVLDAVVVEVTCVHQGYPAGSHMIVREERRGFSGSANPYLRALSDVCELALSMAVPRGAGPLLDGPCDDGSGVLTPYG